MSPGSFREAQLLRSALRASLEDEEGRCGGLFFAPWTMLAYTLLFPIFGFDWVWLSIAVLSDLGGYAAGAARRRDVRWYTGP